MATWLDSIRKGETLSASDIDYFMAGADNTDCLGGVLSLIPGFPDLSLACVLHSIRSISDIDAWVHQLEAHIAASGSHWVRFYLHETSDSQRVRLQDYGYRELVELGFVTRLDDLDDDRVVLRRCLGEDDWSRYTQLSLDSGEGPDGFDMDGDSYVRVSRLKVEAGYMSPYLAYLGDRLVGFVNLAVQKEFARCKNLLVHPDFRDQGIGSGIVSSAMRMAAEQEALYFGCYAIAGEPSVKLYNGLGMREVTRQSEWSKFIGRL